jgi:DNA repair protein RadC
MTLTTLLGGATQLKFRQIRAVYEPVAVNEGIIAYLSPTTRYTSPSQIFTAFSFLKNETKEYFITLHLDGKNRIICMDTVSVGSLNQSIVHPREVFKTALLSSAASLVLIHNHPSLDPSPSAEDLSITRRLKEAGLLLGVHILDHIIIGESYLSFVEQGLL